MKTDNTKNFSPKFSKKKKDLNVTKCERTCIILVIFFGSIFGLISERTYKLEMSNRPKRRRVIPNYFEAIPGETNILPHSRVGSEARVKTANQIDGTKIEEGQTDCFHPVQQNNACNLTVRKCVTEQCFSPSVDRFQFCVFVNNADHIL